MSDSKSPPPKKEESEKEAPEKNPKKDQKQIISSEDLLFELRKEMMEIEKRIERHKLAIEDAAQIEEEVKALQKNATEKKLDFYKMIVTRFDVKEKIHAQDQVETLEKLIEIATKKDEPEEGSQEGSEPSKDAQDKSPPESSKPTSKKE